MGDVNQFEFVRRHLAEFEGPVLEVGSKDYGSTPDFRSLFPGAEYVGLDLEPGAGVDIACDLMRTFDEVDGALGARRFGTILCLSVLEHCGNPFRVCENLTRLLRPGGKLYVSVPFSWEFHGYPSDYWRFTPEGVRLLLPELEFLDRVGCVHTPRPGDTRPIDEDLGAEHFSTKRAMRAKRYGRVFDIGLFRVLRAVGLGRWLFGYSRVFPPVMIDMVGVSPAGGVPRPAPAE